MHRLPGDHQLGLEGDVVAAAVGVPQVVGEVAVRHLDAEAVIHPQGWLQRFFARNVAANLSGSEESLLLGRRGLAGGRSGVPCSILQAGLGLFNPDIRLLPSGLKATLTT
jgi:hypothetical protein